MSWFKSPKWGLRLAAVWLILFGITSLFPESLASLNRGLPILAIVAGVLMLLDR